MRIVRKSNLNPNPELFFIQIRELNIEEHKDDVQFGILIRILEEQYLGLDLWNAVDG